MIHLLSQGQDTEQFESYMPPVGLGWTGTQYDALVAYIKATPKLATAPPASRMRRSVRSSMPCPTSYHCSLPRGAFTWYAHG